MLSTQPGQPTQQVPFDRFPNPGYQQNDKDDGD